MANPEIERSTERRFSRADIQRKIRESKAFWSSPEGRAEARRQQKRKQASIRRNRGVKFPQLLGTKPAAKPSTWAQFDGLTRNR